MLNYKNLYFDADAATNVSADFEPAISIDHTNRLADSIASLQRVLGITALQPMAAGTQVKVYKYAVTDPASTAAEGDIIPLTHVQRALDRTLTIELKKVRALTTAEAIQKVGRAVAIEGSDKKLESEVRKDIRDQFFGIISAASGVAAGGSTLQAAAAQAWGAVSAYFEDTDANPVYFLNPADVATYLGSAAISTQTEFGFRYAEDFLGLGSAIISKAIPQGSVYATAVENLNGAYIPQGGDLGDAFDLTYDESGMVGMTHSRADDRASIQTLVMYGVVFYAEDLAGVFHSYIGDGPTRVELDKHAVTVTAAAGDNHTASLTATKVPSSASVTWASSDTSKATVSSGTVTGVAAGSAVISATITVNGKTYSDECVVTVS